MIDFQRTVNREKNIKKYILLIEKEIEYIFLELNNVYFYIFKNKKINQNSFSHNFFVPGVLIVATHNK